MLHLPCAFEMPWKDLIPEGALTEDTLILGSDANANCAWAKIL